MVCFSAPPMDEKVLSAMGPKLAALPPGLFLLVCAVLGLAGRLNLSRLYGSMCPITLGHVQGFLEARRLLLRESEVPAPARLEHFSDCLGFFSLNGDMHVGRKLRAVGRAALDYADRRECVRLAVEEHEWLGLEGYEGASLAVLTERWPKLKFVHFCMNGADDVVKHRKYTWARRNARFITMGRPGFTEAVREGMADAKVDPDAGLFVLGPELPDISSTAAREALIAGDTTALEGVLHPKVTQWCLENEAFRAETQPSLIESSVLQISSGLRSHASGMMARAAAVIA